MKVVCRARKSKSCYHGRDCETVYGEDSMADDGTFDGESVICDACYIAGGQPSIYVGRPEGWPSRQEVIEHVDREMGLD
jgi:hypothetical protein